MPAPLPPGTRLQRRYIVRRVVGEGDFSTVYAAADTRAARRRLVALKQLPMQLIVDCERQADLRAALRHPALLPVLDCFVTATHAYLVEPLIRGRNLEQTLAAAPGFLPEARVVGWARQLCAALAELHTHPLHPIIFRDLKPNNLMLDRAERVYLTDFGLARAFPAGFFDQRRPSAAQAHWRRGYPLGTAGYAPREQHRGVVTPRSDVYGLGATLHHLLTRRDPRRERPFSAEHIPLRALNPALSPGLEAVVMKALARRPADRFGSMAEFGAALAALAA
ncbi:MAG: serine/threonine protein kinase [Anaerolineales bacterium]|nr:serine/threonine protein kinase [Anaerolineales bacterium]